MREGLRKWHADVFAFFILRGCRRQYSQEGGDFPADQGYYGLYDLDVAGAQKDFDRFQQKILTTR
jgi:hypothetical protein